MYPQKTFLIRLFFHQELQIEMTGLEETRDELIEHADYVVGLLKLHSRDVADETERSVKEVLDAYEK